MFDRSVPYPFARQNRACGCCNKTPLPRDTVVVKGRTYFICPTCDAPDPLSDPLGA